MTQDDMILTPEDAALLLAIYDGRPVLSFTGPEARAQLLERIEECAAKVPLPLNGDKVWYGLTIGLVRTGAYQNQSPTIVRARNQAEAVRLLNAAGANIGSHHFRCYWSVTRNRDQLRAATRRGVWVQRPNGDWVLRVAASLKQSKTENRS